MVIFATKEVPLKTLLVNQQQVYKNKMMQFYAFISTYTFGIYDVFRKHTSMKKNSLVRLLKAPMKAFGGLLFP